MEEAVLMEDNLATGDDVCKAMETNQDDSSIVNPNECVDGIKEGVLLRSKLPNGCVNHTHEDKVLSLTQNDITHNEHTSQKSETTEESDKVNSTAVDGAFAEGGDINNEVEQTSQSNSQLDCDMDSVELDGDLTTSSDGATDSLSTAISRVSISDTESSSRTDSESKPLRPLTYVEYESEKQMPDIMRLITKDLSEPYSIYTYRYFIHNWPKLCFLTMDADKCVGAIVCKLDLHKKMVRRGYIAMLAVDENYRRRGIGSHLVMKAIRAMVSDDCDEVVLETEITNKAALRLYENLGFVRDKRLFRYYLNGVDALRLKLWLR